MSTTRRLSRHTRSVVAGCVFGGIVLGLPSVGRAALMIQAVLTDLPDTIPGQDLWNASYTLSGGTFLTNQGFTIYFDPLAYTAISAPLSPIPSGWSAITIQPDVLLAAPGFLDGLALVDNPTLAQPFRVNFTWLQPGQPATQPFETYDQRGAFQITGTGQTVVGVAASVPEPGTAVAGMCLAGFLALTGRGRARRAADA